MQVDLFVMSIIISIALMLIKIVVLLAQIHLLITAHTDLSVCISMSPVSQQGGLIIMTTMLVAAPARNLNPTVTTNKTRTAKLPSFSFIPKP
jgi:hypothetical protein